MKTTFIAVLLAASLPVISLASDCTVNTTLEQLGFQIESPTQFGELSNHLFKELNAENSTYVLDTTGTVFSSSANQMVKVTSYDNTSTPHQEMYGDILVVEDTVSGQPIEVRWYKNGVKSLVYSSDHQACATALVPLATNVLF